MSLVPSSATDGLMGWARRWVRRELVAPLSQVRREDQQEWVEAHAEELAEHLLGAAHEWAEDMGPLPRRAAA